MAYIALDPAVAPRMDMRIAVGLALAAVIAWFQPFDLAFAALSLGQPVLRAFGIVALALAGLAFARRIGLRIAPAGEAWPLLYPVLVAAVVAVACAALDVVFRPALQPRYVQFITSAPLALRLAGYMTRAFNENIIYRLFLGSALTWSLGQVWRGADGRPRRGAFWIGFALAQLVNVWVNVSSQAPLSAQSVAHDLLRYVAPGMVWSWLFWRRGFQANEIACTSVHLVFQPLAGAWLGG